MNELIPELHDVLKLTILDHYFSDFDKFKIYEPKTKSWDGVRTHHLAENYPAYPYDRDTFFLCFADNQAASFSRHLEGKYLNIIDKVEKDKKIRPYVFKLWRPEESGEDRRLRSDQEVIQLLKFLQSDPDFETFARQYNDILIARPEDMKLGRNVTSLFTHLVLTGKFYRILRASPQFQIDEKQIKPDRQLLLDLLKLKERTWKIHLAQLEFDFPQNPYRARDFWVFDLLQQALDQIEKRFPDNLLMRFENQVLLMYDDTQIINEIVSIAQGFLIFKVAAIQTFSEIRNKLPDPHRLGGRKESYYPDLPDLIYPPLCEICQMAQAQYTWPDDYVTLYNQEAPSEEPREELCPRCFDIRKSPSRLQELSKWSETGDAIVAWVRRSLDYSALVESLAELYWHYLRTFIPSIPREDAHIRFSLIEEFSRDYQKFVSDLCQEVESKFGEDRCEIINDWLWCIKLTRRSEIFSLLKIYHQVLLHHFPVFTKMNEQGMSPSCPIYLSIAICRAKFPFFQVWRELKTPKAEVYIVYPGHGTLTTSASRLEALLIAGHVSYPKTALHGLAEVAKISEALAKVKFEDSYDKKEYPLFQKLKNTAKPLGLDFRSLLTLAQLLED